MSWVKNNTWNLLDRFQVRVRQEPYKFNQIDSDYNNYGEAIWVQSERDELNYQIKTMFDEMREWLGFYPRPIWKQIKVPIDQYYAYWNQHYNIPESAWLLGFGVRAVELVEAGVTVTKTGDYANFTITTDEITDGELVIFHTSDDAFGNTADDRFRILPDNIYYDGTNYQIRVPYARFIKPVLWLDEFNNGDPQDRKSYSSGTSSNFSSTVDFYRVYNDSTTDGKLIGSPYNYTSNTTLQEEDVNLVLLDSEDALFSVLANTTISTFNPTHVLVNAYIGHPLTEQNQMYPIIEEFIIRKAKVEMGINARLAEAKISEQWNGDWLPAYTKPSDSSAQTGIGYRPNPVGARNVDVEMFKKLLPISNWRGKINDRRFWLR